MAVSHTITSLPPDALHPYAGNPRRHTRAQIKKLASLIKRYGFTSAIAVDEEHVVLAGHGRLEAAKLLGLPEVPVLLVEGLSAPEKIALRIADNRVADESSFDRKMLSVELRTLLEVGLELDATGLDAIELDPILSIGVETHPPEPALPDLPVDAFSQPGDLWQLGDHRLLCGDARDPDAFGRLLETRHASMVFTDPPWNVKVTGNVSSTGKHGEFQMASGEMSEAEFRSFLLVALQNLHAHTIEGSLHYVCMDWRGIADLVGVGRDVFQRLMNIIVWAKPNGGMGSFYRSQHEMIAIFKKGSGPHINNIQLGKKGRYRSNLWQYPGASGFSPSRKRDLEDHPTIKPVAMVADAILDGSKPGDVILDCFGGAGTTLLAAHRTGRRAVLIELEPRFVDVTLRRFEEATGIEPRLLPTMQTVPAIRRERSRGKDDPHVG
jgi:DNA modification methylase